MDINAHTFGYHLPLILQDLATCCFVSIDFEFSGIAKALGDSARGPQTLQDRYAEVKGAADRYRILQIGLTICHEDPTQTGAYILKPYNFYLSPIIDQKLDVERDISFQSGAVEFLLENRFEMDSLFNGVRYLSREEETLAMSKAAARRNRSAVHKTLGVKEDEHESLSFLRDVRSLVDEWLALGKTREDFLNIPPPTRNGSQQSQSFPSVLNSFQRRLVHQLIEVEYPSLVTISRPKFIQIVDYDENREKAARDQKLIWTQERVGRQIGFRWIAEALAGGNLSNLSPGFFRAILMDPSTLTPIQDLTGFSERLKQQIKANRPILVGHNLFADLVYFCRCFFGPLPDKVEDFQAMAHELFPTLVDTKYLATHDCGSINPRSSLTEINASLARVAGPGIRVHPHYGKYNAQEVAHEAGYDSLLTAKIFIKLSYQLREGGASKLPGALAPTYGHQQVPFVVSGPTSQPDVPAPYWNVNSTPHMPGPSGNPMYGYQNSTYGLCTQFGGLQVCSANAYGHRTPLQTSSYEMPANRGESIPPLGREFWKNYGNKLRVFGTEERVCDMGKPTHK